MCSSLAERARCRALLGVVLCGALVSACQAEPQTGAPVAGQRLIGPGDLQPYSYTVIDSVRFDVDGDGADEGIQLLATVERNERGELLWEDGHHWAVIVADDSVRYPLFERFLPRVRAELLVLRQDADDAPVIVVRTTPTSCTPEEQTFALSVAKFTFDRVRGGFVEEAEVEASGTGVCRGGEK
jgi:hypothetical protein